MRKQESLNALRNVAAADAFLIGTGTGDIEIRIADGN